MKALYPNRDCGFTVIELFCIVAALVTLVLLSMPMLHRARDRAQRIGCVSCLKQVGLAFRIWAGDHEERRLMESAQNPGCSTSTRVPGLNGPTRAMCARVMSDWPTVPCSRSAMEHSAAL